jgi:nucleotide-binding universal stress UspA family protein
MSSIRPAKPTLVLAAVDDTSVSDDVLRKACHLASSIREATLHLVRVVEPPTMPLDGVVAKLAYGSAFDDFIDGSRRELEAMASAAHEHFQGPVTPHIIVGAPKREIVDLASRLEADVVVVGSHGRTQLARFLLGSVSEYVVRHAVCSVLVTRPKESVDIPPIEPPCPDCLAVRAKSGDVMAWCARHSIHHPHAALHYESPASYGVGSTFLRPNG